MSKLKLTIAQGTNLLRAVRDMKWPENLGDKKYSHQTRATFTHEIGQLYKLLRKASPILVEEQVPCFGPREAWEERPATQEQIDAGSDPVAYSPKDGAPEVELELNGTQRKGLYRVLLVWLHPLSRYFLPIGRQEDAAWPFAEQIGATKQLAEEIGLAANETVEIKWDEDRERAADANKASSA